MPANIIDVDVADPRLEPYQHLSAGVAGPRQGIFVVEGHLIVERLLGSDLAVESVLVEAGKEAKYAGLTDAPLYRLSRKDIETVVGFDFHRGVLACAKRRPWLNIDELHFSHDSELPKVVMAVLGVTDQENVGSLLRSAAAMGVNQILLGPQTIDPFRRRVVRVSMATALFHRFYDLDQPALQLPVLSQRLGADTVATTLDDDAADLATYRSNGRPVILMVGSEADGIAPGIQEVATHRLRIPMQLGTDSLNVAVAGAIFLHQLTR